MPLLAHIPDIESLEFPNSPISAIDVFPTITNLAGIDVDYHGYGQDLLSPSKQEISRFLGVSENTIKSRLYRALQRFISN